MGGTNSGGHLVAVCYKVFLFIFNPSINNTYKVLGPGPRGSLNVGIREKPDGDNLQRDGGHEEGKTRAAPGTQRGSGILRDIACTSETRPGNFMLFLYRLAFEHDDKYNVNSFAIRTATGVTPRVMFSLNKKSMVIEIGHQPY